MSILQKLIETYFLLEKYYDNDQIDYDGVDDVFQFLCSNKCCAFCEYYSSCESANKQEEGVCASYTKNKEIVEHGLHSFLLKHYKK